MLEIKCCGVQTSDLLDVISNTFNYIGFIGIPGTPRFSNDIPESVVTTLKHFRTPVVVVQGIDDILVANIKRNLTIMQKVQNGIFGNDASDASDDFYDPSHPMSLSRVVFQFHGNESPEEIMEFKNKHQCKVWKAISVYSKDSIVDAHCFDGIVEKIIFDSPKTANEPFDYSLLEYWKGSTPFGIAGKLNHENVKDAIDTGASLIDVCSSVEEDFNGLFLFKSYDKMKQFIDSAIDGSGVYRCEVSTETLSNYFGVHEIDDIIECLSGWLNENIGVGNVTTVFDTEVEDWVVLVTNNTFYGVPPTFKIIVGEPPAFKIIAKDKDTAMELKLIFG